MSVRYRCYSSKYNNMTEQPDIYKYFVDITLRKDKKLEI